MRHSLNHRLFARRRVPAQKLCDLVERFSAQFRQHIWRSVCVDAQAYPRIEGEKLRIGGSMACVARLPSDRHTQGSISRSKLSASGTVRGPSHGSKRSGASCFTRRTPKYKSSITLSVPEERDPACPNAPPVTMSLTPFLSTRP